MNPLISPDEDVLSESLRNLDFRCNNGCYTKIKFLLHNAIEDKTSITTKEKHIRDLEIKVAKLEVIVSTSADKIKDKEEVINTLKSSLSVCNSNSNKNEPTSRLDGLMTSLREKEKQLQAMGSRLSEKEIQLKEAETKAVCFFNQIQQMNAHLREYESMIKLTPNSNHLLLESTQQLAARDRHITELENTIKSKEAQMVLLELESSHNLKVGSMSQIEDNVKELKEKTDLLATQEAKIKEQESSIAHLQSEIVEKDRKLEEVEKLLTKFKAQLKEKDDKQLEKLLKDSKAKINGYTNTIKQLKNNLSELQTGATETKAENVAHQETIADLKRKLKENEAKFTSCIDEMKKRIDLKEEGTYKTHPEVLLLMGSGWNPIQVRHIQHPSAAFMLQLEFQCVGYNYKDTQFWLGLENLHVLTNLQRHELYIHIVDFDNSTTYARYDNFVIDRASEKYKIKSLGKYTGSAGDGMRTLEKTDFAVVQRGLNKNNCIISSWWHPKEIDLMTTCDLQAIKTPGYRTHIWWLGDVYKSVTMLVKPFAN